MQPIAKICPYEDIMKLSKTIKCLMDPSVILGPIINKFYFVLRMFQLSVWLCM